MKVRQFEADLQKADNALKTVNLALLPDKGVSIKLKHKALESSLMDEVKILSKMVVKKGKVLLTYCF